MKDEFSREIFAFQSVQSKHSCSMRTDTHTDGQKDKPIRRSWWSLFEIFRTHLKRLVLWANLQLATKWGSANWCVQQWRVTHRLWRRSQRAQLRDVVLLGQWFPAFRNIVPLSFAKASSDSYALVPTVLFCVYILSRERGKVNTPKLIELLRITKAF